MARIVYFIHKQEKESVYVKPHFHKNYELVYYLKGNGISHYQPKSFQITYAHNNHFLFVSENLNKNSKTIEFRDNTCILYPPYTTHDEQHKSEADIIAINFSLAEDEDKLPFLSFTDSSLGIKKYIDKILKEHEQKKSNYARMLDALLTELIIQIDRFTAANNNNNNNDIIEQVVSYLDDYFSSKIDLNDLAYSLGYSTDHFRHLFKQKMGISPKYYIQEKRIALAKQQLLYTDLPLKTIAVNCGYEDYLQFSAYFKKVTSFSPLDFRNKNKSN